MNTQYHNQYEPYVLVSFNDKSHWYPAKQALDLIKENPHMVILDVEDIQPSDTKDPGQIHHWLDLIDQLKPEQYQAFSFYAQELGVPHDTDEFNTLYQGNFPSFESFCSDLMDNDPFFRNIPIKYESVIDFTAYVKIQEKDYMYGGPAGHVFVIKEPEL